MKRNIDQCILYVKVVSSMCKVSYEILLALVCQYNCGEIETVDHIDLRLYLDRAYSIKSILQSTNVLPNFTKIVFIVNMIYS